MISRILLATDGSEASHRAAEMVADLAKHTGAAVFILHVVSLPDAVTALSALAGGVIQDYVDRTEREALGEALKIVEKARVPVETAVRSGHAAAEIVESARGWKADLVVVGSRGLGEFQSYLLGSVSDRVTHHAPCSVLIVR